MGAVIRHLAQLKGETQSLLQLRISQPPGRPATCPLGLQGKPPCTPAVPLLPFSFPRLDHLHPRLAGAWGCLHDCALTRVRTAALLQNAPEASHSSSKTAVSTQASNGNSLSG